MSDLPNSAAKVRDAGAALGLEIRIVEMAESTRTAEEAAAACNVGVGQIVKSLVFIGATSGRAYLMLVSGTNRVDEAGVAATLGEPLQRPNAARVRDLTGYAIGGIPPFGHATDITTFIDADLLTYDIVWAAAGTPRCVFSIDPNALAQATGAKVIKIG